MDCPAKNRNSLEGASLYRETEIALIGAETGDIHPNLWIGDTRATSHMTCCKTGMFDIKPSNRSVLVDDGRSLKVEKVGKMKLTFKGKNQETTQVLLEDVRCVPKLKVNLFSFTVTMKKGAKIYTEGTSIILEKEGKHVVFGTNIPMGSSFLVADKVISMEGSFATSKRKEMKLEKFPRMLGHPSVEITKNNAIRSGLKLVGDMKGMSRLHVGQDLAQKT
jgi:hypothetical protein